MFFEGGDAWSDDFKKVGVVEGRWKLVHDLDEDRFALFDLESDPEEARDLWALASTKPEVARLRAQLDVFREESLQPAGQGAASERGTEIEFSEEEREQLRLLGYIDDEPESSN